MRKAFLTILWAIIISGSIFLITNHVKTLYIENSNEDKNLIQTQISRNSLTDSSTTDESSSKIARNTETENGNDTNNKENTNTENPISFSNLVKEGDDFFNNENYEQAIESYTQALEIQSSSTDALKKLGKTYFKLQNFEESLKTFKSAQELAPKSDEIKLYIAKNLLNLNQYEEAKTLIWELPNDYLEGQYYKAITLLIYDKKYDAETLFKEIVKNTNIEENLKTKIQLYLDQYSAFKLYTEENEIFLETLLANALVENEEYFIAINELFKIIEKQSNYRDAWLVLGYSYLKTKQIQEAIDSLTQAKELDPRKDQTLFLLGLSYYLNDELEKAIFYLEKAKTEGFENTDIIDLKLAEIYKLKEKYEKSAKIYENLIAKEIYTIEIFKNLSDIYLDEYTEIQKTEELALKAIEIFPDHYITYFIIGKTNFYRNDLIRSEEYLKESIKLNPNFGESYFYLGKIYESKSNYLLAQSYYKLANTFSQNEDESLKAIENFNKINTILSNKNYQVNLL